MFRPRDTALIVIALPEGHTIFESNADRPLKPASTLKILTCTTALSMLGPEFIFETLVHADAAPDDSGTIIGNLYIEGLGAPDLVGEAWWLIVRRLATLGIRRVTGDLVGDESHFDSERRPPGWPQAGNDSAYNAPIGALSSNFNAITVRIDPARRIEDRPRITLEPATDFFDIVNRAAMTTRSTSIRVDRRYRGGRNILAVRGRMRIDGSPMTIYRSVEEPALYAMHTFRSIARTGGITIAGELKVGAVSGNAVEIYRHASRPLGALVRDMNKYSNNFMAEMMLKTLGARIEGPPGTRQDGLRVVRRYLTGIGADPSRSTIVDGSGLSSHNRVPARLIAHALARAANDFTIGPDLAASFPIGGADGTLEDRFESDPGGRRVRAKTGRVAGSRTLAGYVANAEGRRFAFALLAGSPRGSLESVYRALDGVVGEVAASTEEEIAPLLERPSR